MRKAFQQQGFTRLFAGLSTSMLGDSVMLLVLSMWVKTLTHSNGAAGLTFFWMMVPALFAPLYGMYIDRIKRKPLLVWGSVVSALMVLPLMLVDDARFTSLEAEIPNDLRGALTDLRRDANEELALRE